MQSDFRDSPVTAGWAGQPGNVARSPGTDGWRLAHWMTPPPDAPVGVGLAIRMDRFGMDELFNGVPVCLSSTTIRSNST